MDEDFLDLKRRQLDEKLLELKKIEVPTVPKGGWSRSIRSALGMSTRALGRRIGVTQSAVFQLEAREDAMTISLTSLSKLADGLDCDLVYALVPRTSLVETIERQAESKARIYVTSISTSMALEKQAISAKEENHQIKTVAKNLLIKPSTTFWE